MASTANNISDSECIEAQDSGVNFETITVKILERQICVSANALSDSECHQIQGTDIDLETITVFNFEDANIFSDTECHETQENCIN